jgi:hypothetical protein
MTVFGWVTALECCRNRQSGLLGMLERAVNVECLLMI